MRRRRTASAVLLGLALGSSALTGCAQGGNESTLTLIDQPTASGTDGATAGETGSPDVAPGTSFTESADGSPSQEPTATGAPRVVRAIATGLQAPWGLDFLQNGDALVTERDTTRVLRISPSGDVRQVGELGIAEPVGEAGALGVALSPDFATDRRVFFYVTTAEDNRVVRTTLRGDALGELEPILTGIPKGPVHDGGRLLFGPDGFLYVSTGEIGERELAQDRDSLAGKILRITADGEPAPGNPFGTAIWSWGHRNVQGLAFVEDQLYASEFGASSFDELNRIVAGENYGWPEVEGEGGTEAGFVDPEQVWGTDVASPSGLAAAAGHLWMASLRGQRLWRIAADTEAATDPAAFFIGDYGRMRTVATDPDGNLWVTTSNRDGRGDPGPDDDQILLVSP